MTLNVDWQRNLLRDAGRLPGYREPTRELCAACGATCCRAPGYMTLSGLEMRALKARGKIAVLCDGQNRWVVDFAYQLEKRCPFLEHDNLCRVYAARPAGCRRYPQRPMPGCRAWPKEAG